MIHQNGKQLIQISNTINILIRKQNGKHKLFSQKTKHSTHCSVEPDAKLQTDHLRCMPNQFQNIVDQNGLEQMDGLRKSKFSPSESDS